MIMPYIRSAKHLRDGAILTFNDITELKTIQYQLDISNKLLNSTIESASMGTWSLDLQTQEYFPSDRLKELYCYQAENMSYETSLTLISDDHRAMVETEAEACIEAGKPFSVEFALKEFCDGKVRWLGATGNVTHDTRNKARYFTGVAQDISDKKLGELLKDDLLAMASHELKTPLTLIQTYTEILQEQVVMEEKAIAVDLFSKTMVQLKKVGKLINGFLQDSSVDNGKIYLVEQSFEINKLVRETIEEVLLTEKGMDILFIPYNELVITADRDKIGQVISNLLHNAIKYSPSGKDIIVTLNQVGDMVEVSVIDEGLGINSKFIPKLFDRHYRIENASTKNIAGFGLGLYLAAEIIKKNNGKIWVNSIEGKGSTFSFSLPL